MTILEKYDKLCDYSTINFPSYTIEKLAEIISVKSPVQIDDKFIQHCASLGLRIESISPSKDRIFFKEVRKSEY